MWICEIRRRDGWASSVNGEKRRSYSEGIDKRGNDNRISHFVNILKEYRDIWVKGPNKVEAPCSDLVDATWISLFVEENLEKLLLGKKV